MYSTEKMVTAPEACECVNQKFFDKEMSLFNGQEFFVQVNGQLKETPPDAYCMVAVDIEHFKLFNKLYGRDQGNDLLKYLTECINRLLQRCDGIGGYLGGDDFGIFMPDNQELLEQLRKDISDGVRKLSNTVGFLPAFGVCSIHEVTLSAVTIYDRAVIALSYVIGNYVNRVCYYDDSMSERIEEEIMLLSEIQDGIDRQEFVVYIQPQCDIFTGKIVGGESLVRWNQPEKGMISPAVFIPVLEKNGFIAELDRYIWDKVCCWLRTWLDMGYHPVPISINVSRIDIFSMDVLAFLQELLHTYRLTADLIKVEITESAYAEDNEKIRSTVKELRDSGFIVMMDDFGSGYSSLNMLKNIAVDVLKIDMRFLEIDEDNKGKGIGILESVINMSRNMEVPIIVEGVETKEQENYIQGMGCRYTQGFYYYKPMPAEQFAEILSDSDKLDFAGLWYQKFEPLHLREFLDSNLFNDSLLNELIGAIAFYDVYENKIEVTRVNSQYYKLLGVPLDSDDAASYRFWEMLSTEEQKRFSKLFELAYLNPLKGSRGYLQYTQEKKKRLWICLKIFFLQEREGHKLFFASLTDRTAAKEGNNKDAVRVVERLEPPEQHQHELEEYYADISDALGIAKVNWNQKEKSGYCDIIYINKRMEHLCGELQQLKYLTAKFFEITKEKVMEYAYQAAYLGEEISYELYSPLTYRYFRITAYQFEYGYLTFLIQDITHEHIEESALQKIADPYQEIYYIHLEDEYYRMIYPDESFLLERGNYHQIIERWFALAKISAYDERNVRTFLSVEHLRKALADQDTTEYRYKKQTKQGEEWNLIRVMVSERKGTRPITAIMTIRTIDALLKEQEQKRRENMSDFLAHTGDGFFIYNACPDEKLLFANQNVWDIYGCDSMEEFNQLVGNSFRGMVHPDDLERVEREISEQIADSEKKIDYVEYRIIRKDGEVRWITDCGHLYSVNNKDGIFYVFIYDVTDYMRNSKRGEG